MRDKRTNGRKTRNVRGLQRNNLNCQKYLLIRQRKEKARKTKRSDSAIDTFRQKPSYL